MNDIPSYSSSSAYDFSADGCDTVSKLFRLRVQELGNKVAMREKKLGIWQAITWNQYGKRAKAIGMGLLASGLEHGDVCSILSEDCPEWMIADKGVVGASGITNGIYATDAPAQVSHLLQDSRSRFLFVENEEQLDKVLQIREEVPLLKKVIVFDPKGLRGFSDSMVFLLEDFYEYGRSGKKDCAEKWERSIDDSRPDDVLVLIYTSGTTGPPKGSMITHRNALFMMQANSATLPLRETDEQLCFLPLSHIAERTVSIFWSLKFKTTVNFAESMETVGENLREVAPTIFFAVPRVWEKLHSGIEIKLGEATMFGRWVYERAIRIGHQVVDHVFESRPIPPGLKMLHFLANRLVLGNIRRLLGLHRVRWTISGAAPIAPDLIRWYHVLGVPMYEVYGQTESSALITTNHPGCFRVGSIGKPIAGTEIRLSEEGEILTRGPHIFKGYLNLEDKTKEVLQDGWLYTGDVGEVDSDGFYRITDRMKDIIITAGGKNISPSEIENQLKFSPFISDAVVIGDRRRYLSCLVMIDHDNVVKFAQDKNVPFTNYASLCHAQEVQDLIGIEIERVNRNFARVETIKRFRLIDQQLVAEDEELTPTMKLKRSLINKKYRSLIESMYGEP